MIGPEYEALRDDIKARGLDMPIVLDLKDRILDGRNRARACEETGVEPHYRVYNGDDPIGFVLGANLHRRHLNESQRALVATKLSQLGRGQRIQKDETGKSAALTQEEAAEKLNVSERQVRKARAVLEQAEPETIAAIERGELSLNAAEEKHRPAVEERPADARALASMIVGALKNSGCSTRYVNTTADYAEVVIARDGRAYRLELRAQ